MEPVVTADMQVAAATLLSNEAAAPAQTVLKILGNILRSPQEAKFRQLKLCGSAALLHVS